MHVRTTETTPTEVPETDFDDNKNIPKKKKKKSKKNKKRSRGNSETCDRSRGNSETCDSDDSISSETTDEEETDINTTANTTAGTANNRCEEKNSSDINRSLYIPANVLDDPEKYIDISAISGVLPFEESHNSQQEQLHVTSEDLEKSTSGNSEEQNTIVDVRNTHEDGIEVVQEAEDELMPRNMTSTPEPNKVLEEAKDELTARNITSTPEPNKVVQEAEDQPMAGNMTSTPEPNKVLQEEEDEPMATNMTSNDEPNEVVQEAGDERIARNITSSPEPKQDRIEVDRTPQIMQNIQTKDNPAAFTGTLDEILFEEEVTTQVSTPQQKKQKKPAVTTPVNTPQQRKTALQPADTYQVVVNVIEGNNEETPSKDVQHPTRSSHQEQQPMDTSENPNPKKHSPFKTIDTNAAKELFIDQNIDVKGKQTPNRTSKRPFQCKNCDQTFTRKDNRNRHQERCCNKTTDKPGYPCHLCGKVFEYKKNLTRHMKVHSY